MEIAEFKAKVAEFRRKKSRAKLEQAIGSFRMVSDENWQEFESYLRLCTLIGGFKYLEDASSESRKFSAESIPLMPGESILAVYENVPAEPIRALFLSRRAFYFSIKHGLYRFPHDLHFVQLPQTFLTHEEPKLTDRGVLMHTLNSAEEAVFIPVQGATNGELHMFKIAWLVSLARAALQNEKSQTNQL